MTHSWITSNFRDTVGKLYDICSCRSDVPRSGAPVDPDRGFPVGLVAIVVVVDGRVRAGGIEGESGALRGGMDRHKEAVLKRVLAEHLRKSIL